MIFKYNKKTDKKRWESMLKYKGMFGMEFPDKISITEKDEKIAEERILEFSTLWNKDKELKETIFKIYKYNLPKRLTCYITTTKTSAINFKEKLVLLSIHTPYYNFSNPIPTTIIHEFSHIAFLEKWSDFCKKIGYTDNGIQELKEALTVINNIEFEGIVDNGYPVHKDIREIVKNIWLGTHNLEKIISDPKIIDLINSLNTIIKK